jgi:hypothetical protein
MESSVPGVGPGRHATDNGIAQGQHYPGRSAASARSFLTGKIADPPAPAVSAFHPLHAMRAMLAEETRDLIEPHSVMSVVARFRVELGRPANKAKPHQLPAKLVVSLTSHPRRFATLALTVRALLQQTVKADHTVLWVARADRRLLPQEVLDLRAAGLEIRVAEDVKSYMKILPALRAFSDAFICTADDDTYYWPTWLQELVDGYDAGDPAVTCHRAHGITLDAQARPHPYAQWQRNVRPRGKAMHLFPTGCMGVLYPPGTLAHDGEDRKAALELCPLADDVWLYWIGQRNGAQYKTVGRRRHQITWRGSQQSALWSFNARGGNDLQIRHIAKKYGYPAIFAKIAEASVRDSTILAPSAAELTTYAWASP